YCVRREDARAERKLQALAGVDHEPERPVPQPVAVHAAAETADEGVHAQRLTLAAMSISRAGHPGTRAPGHASTRAPGHPGTRAPGHPGTRAPGHPGTRAPGHPAGGAECTL